MTNFFRKIGIVIIAGWFVLATPAAVFAQETTGAPENTGAPQPTGTPEEETGTAEEQTGPQMCTGAGCGQGYDQGTDQGTDQGGPTAEELGATQNENGDWVFPEGTEDTRVGAQQGVSQNEIEAQNSNTGADSSNSNDVDSNTSDTTSVDNDVTDTTAATADATTGVNTGNKNTGTGNIDTGDASIGATVVKNDNSTVVGGSAGLNSSAHDGNHDGDLNLQFDGSTADLSDGSSVQVTNEKTGSNSDNTNDIEQSIEKLIEIQNDGKIDNDLDLAANTGDNEADKNTGGGEITTGDANVAATLINLLNTSVINGDLLISVQDIFGDLTGNVNVDNLASLAAAAGLGPSTGSTSSLQAGSGQATDIEVVNEDTGESSTNNTEIKLEDTEEFNVDNEADITTDVNADANTGDNEASKNTGGSEVDTGDASVQASNVSVANTTVEGGSWGLFIVNALNGFLGFLVGDDGTTRQLSQNETIREIEARNSETGADSENNNNITQTTSDITNVDNDAEINNNLNLSANTGRNQASKNTGAGKIATGNANVQATAVNVANTTVKDGSLFIGVVNVFGDWFGDLMYDGASLLGLASNNNSSEVNIDAENSNTGANSDNNIDVDIDKLHKTNIDNDADLAFNVNADVNTGGNKTNSNTLGAGVTTGDSLLAVNSRAVANLVGIAGPGGITVDMQADNDTTGFKSKNKIKADINDERVIEVDNIANVSTVLASLINTGDNEANKNTGGASISTGDAGFEGAIDNLVNQVMVALGDANITVDADFENRLTGALSENTNDLTANYEAIVDVLNRAGIDNVIDLLLNTGNNKANKNTGGGIFGAASISSGDVCVGAGIHNNANETDISGATKLTLGNNADVNNDANIDANTGNNEQKYNTSGDTSKAVDDNNGICDKLALAPEPTPQPPTGGGPVDEPSEDNGGDENGGGGDDGNGGGEDEDGDEDDQGSVAAAVDNKPTGRINGGIKFSRFPVAGGEQVAKLFAGKSGVNTTWLLLIAVMFISSAWYLDRRASRSFGYA